MKRVQRVLCPTDFSEESKSALLYATQVASLFDAEIHLLHATVMHDSGSLSAFPSYRVFESTVSDRARSALDELLPSAAEHKLRVHRVERRGVAAAEVILDYAAQSAIDMIVMATHGRRGLRRLFLGSVAEEVVRLAPTPVLTVRGRTTLRRGEGGAILAAVDFSAISDDVIDAAVRFARWTDSRVVALHAIAHGADPERARARLIERVGGDFPVDCEVAVGDAGEAILDATRRHRPDLLVLGSHHAGWLDRVLIGSVSERVVQRAEGSVLTLKGKATGGSRIANIAVF